MRCPHCLHPDSRVLETRATDDTTKRRRQCLACGFRFTTVERLERRLPLVIKRGGAREPFDRDKLVAGIRVACRRRPVTAERIERAADRVEQRVSGLGAEVASADIGRCVMEELRGLDPVAWVRFASVYLNVDSLDSFAALIAPWTTAEPVPAPAAEPADAPTEPGDP